MKTRYWILLFSLVAILCIFLSAYFFFGMNNSECAYVYSDGSLVMTLPLDENAEYTIPFGEDWNAVTVQDGKIAVTDSSCASHDCVHRGFCSGGAPIVCLPNRLIIEFSARAPYDALVG